MILYILALGGGALLWASQPPRNQPWLQLPALVALLYAIGTTQSLGIVALLGLLFALGYVVPQLAELRLPVIISAMLLGSQSLVWFLFALSTAHLWQLETLTAVISIACLGASLMWLEWSVLPLWGTAQNFTRGWSYFPQWVQFVALTGVAGLNWVLFLVAAILARLITAPQQWQPLIGLLLAFALLLSLVNFLGWNRAKNARTLRVAAYGWAGISSSDALVLHEKVVSDAAKQGAKLLVTPEAAFQVENRERFRRSLQALATRHRLALAIGYFDNERQENCIDFVNARGEILGRYVKSHLVPVFERYQRGRGEPCLFQIEEVNFGGLICQDDNFADIAGRYGRSETLVLAIPTHDWAAVKHFHFANSRWRALEYRFGIVRAASNGISAIISFRGELIAYCDHFKEGPKLLVADLPIQAPQITPYAIARDWLPICSGLFVLWKLLVR